jgi:hypothetical protein
MGKADELIHELDQMSAQTEQLGCAVECSVGAALGNGGLWSPQIGRFRGAVESRRHRPEAGWFRHQDLLFTGKAIPFAKAAFSD